jgi:hypothetical protein
MLDATVKIVAQRWSVALKRPITKEDIFNMFKWSKTREELEGMIKTKK